MAVSRKYLPTFENVSDEELQRRLHCWQHCALVSFRTQREVARMHMRCIREEIRRREAERMIGGVAGIVSFPDADSRDTLPTA